MSLSFPPGTEVWPAAGVADMRSGFDGLSARAANVLKENRLSGNVFVFRGRSGDRLKVLFWDGQAMCLFYKRLEKGNFV
ncbi:MAG: IS66 family insertion sequence element accessory protein TnpB [Parvularcula sp.]|nr:IS66 family insertion sequence element accessory protein TnpB [Parvularcula sp.]